MAKFALLNSVDHQHVKIITERSARYGDDVKQALTFPFEFRNVQAFYPILFQPDQNGGFIPVALFGFESRENLFLGEAGWQAAYIPAMMRREPFLIGYQQPAGQSERTRVLSLDMAHPRVNTAQGEALFEPLGGRTPFLENAANLLETIYEGLEHNRAFIAALQEHELLEAVTMDIALKDGSRNQLLGYHCLAEEKIKELPGSVLETFNQNGFLMPMFMALASMANLQRLVELKEQALAAAEAGDGLAG